MQYQIISLLLASVATMAAAADSSAPPAPSPTPTGPFESKSTCGTTIFASGDDCKDDCGRDCVKGDQDQWVCPCCYSSPNYGGQCSEDCGASCEWKSGENQGWRCPTCKI